MRDGHVGTQQLGAAGDRLFHVAAVVDDELQVQARPGAARGAGAGHPRLGLAHVLAEGGIAVPQASRHSGAADLQRLVLREGEDGVALQLGEHERWREATHDGVEQLRHQGIGRGCLAKSSCAP